MNMNKVVIEILQGTCSVVTKTGLGGTTKHSAVEIIL